jgi:hypothetical protein
MNSKWTMPLISKKVMSIVFICDFDMASSLRTVYDNKNTSIFIGSPPKASKSIVQVSLLLPHLTQSLMLIRCSKNRSFIFCDETYKCTRLFSATTCTQLALTDWSHNWCKLKHAQLCLHYDPIARLPLSHTIKSFWEIHSHIFFYFF